MLCKVSKFFYEEVHFNCDIMEYHNCHHPGSSCEFCWVDFFHLQYNLTNHFKQKRTLKRLVLDNVVVMQIWSILQTTLENQQNQSLHFLLFHQALPHIRFDENLTENHPNVSVMHETCNFNQMKAMYCRLAIVSSSQAFNLSVYNFL